MNEVYFTRRLLEALTLAEEAKNAEERSVHLRASRYYRDLLQWPEQRQAIRHVVRLGALLHAANHLLPVVISDLSTHGCRIETDAGRRLRPGTIFALQVEGLAPIEAYIVWQERGEAGCKFLAELRPPLLDAALALSRHVQ